MAIHLKPVVGLSPLILLLLLFDGANTAPLLHVERKFGYALGESPEPSSPSAILQNRLTPAQREAVFWTSTSIAVLVSFVQGAITTLADICESEALWTIRFSLSLYEHWWWTGIATALIVSFGAMIVSFLGGNSNESLGIILLAVTSSIAVFRFAWPAWRNRNYCANRWAAWTGPSRTGIDARFLPLMGDQKKWQSLSNRIALSARRHPVEIHLRWFLWKRSPLIDADPTDLLRTAWELSDSVTSPPHRLGDPKGLPEERKDEQPQESPPFPPTTPPHSEDTQKLESADPIQPQTIDNPSLGSRDLSLTPALESLQTNVVETSPEAPELPLGVYAPVIASRSVSLKWGEEIGFQPRVSRGIISIPRRLLTSNPTTESGHDGRAVCIAHGILGRNKGLAPKNFIINIDIQRMEETSVQWPRPSKVLRGYYEEEMRGAYRGLGDNFVTVATQLALILADSDDILVADWLACNLEQQDYDLNRQVYKLGASPEELELLYRLSYGTMLVSLSTHVLGRRMRPEMSLFTAYWLANNGRLPMWGEGPEMKLRQEKERQDPSGNINLSGSIAAVLSLPPPEMS